MDQRKPVVAMSWAMRQNRNADAAAFASRLVQLTDTETQIEKIVFPSMGTLQTVGKIVADTSLGFGAQNIAPFKHGEYSGEYSIESLTDIGGAYVEIGHWERRVLFGDTDEWINKKVALTLEAGLTPVLCVGEKEKATSVEENYSFLKRQLFNDLLSIEAKVVANLVIAYTPQWAVGKSRAASAPHIHETGKLIRRILEEFYPAEIVEKIRIIYGGSVSPENVGLIVSDRAIDGVLVGRFGSEPERYVEVIKNVAAFKK